MNVKRADSSFKATQSAVQKQWSNLTQSSLNSKHTACSQLQCGKVILNHSVGKSSKQQFCKPHSTVVAEMWGKDIIITTLTARLGGWTSVSEGFKHPLSCGKTIYIPHTKPKVFLLIQQTYQLSLQPRLNFNPKKLPMTERNSSIFMGDLATSIPTPQQSNSKSKQQLFDRSFAFQGENSP